MLNRVILIGRLTKDPQLRYTQGAQPKAVANFSLAVDRNYKNSSGEKETDFFEIVAWRQKAEFVANYFTKGRLVCVEGRLQRDNWTGKDDVKRTVYRIVAENCYFCDSKKSQAGQNSALDFSQPDLNNDDLPF